MYTSTFSGEVFLGRGGEYMKSFLFFTLDSSTNQASGLLDEWPWVRPVWCGTCPQIR